MARAPPSPAPFEVERASRTLSTQSRNLAISASVVTLLLAGAAVRFAKRRRLQRRLAGLQAELATVPKAEVDDDDAAMDDEDQVPTRRYLN